jgi:hypothetical protein
MNIVDFQVTMKQQVSSQNDVQQYGVEVDKKTGQSSPSTFKIMKDFVFAETPASEIGAKI